MISNPYTRATESNHISYLNNNNFPVSMYTNTTDPDELFEEKYVPIAIRDYVFYLQIEIVYNENKINELTI